MGEEMPNKEDKRDEEQARAPRSKAQEPVASAASDKQDKRTEEMPNKEDKQDMLGETDTPHQVDAKNTTEMAGSQASPVQVTTQDGVDKKEKPDKPAKELPPWLQKKSRAPRRNVEQSGGA